VPGWLDERQFTRSCAARGYVIPRRPWLRVGAINGVAAAVAGILYGSGGAAYGQEAAKTGAGAESLQKWW